MDALHVRIAATEISDKRRARSVVRDPDRCVGHSHGRADLEANGLPVVADNNWWGQPGGPRPGQTAAGGAGSISSGGGLSAKPSCGLRGATPGP